MSNPTEVYRAAQAMLTVLEVARMAVGTPEWTVSLMEVAIKQARDAGITERSSHVQ